MKVIGLTGGIGSGKSTVARFLGELGAVVIDADAIGHEALRPRTPVWRQVAAAFGQGVLKPDDEIDREKLGTIVFADTEARLRLNSLVHPYIFGQVISRLEAYRRQGVAVVVVEAPLLLELAPVKPALADAVDEVWVTVAPEATVLRRLRQKSGMTEEQALGRIRSQLSAAERQEQAGVVIDTDCSLDELREKVRGLWPKLDT